MDDSDQTLRVSPARPPASPPCLVYIYPSGPGLGRRYLVGGKPLLLGRDEDCDVPLHDPSVSRRHAQVEASGDGCYAVDLNSTNGTFVNDRRIGRHRLGDGDYLRIGSTILRFLDRDNIEAAYHEELYRLTILDALTGLPNRRYLTEFLARELVRSVRYRRPLALVLLDADRFKAVNDDLGHLGGDEALRQLGALLRSQARPADLAARYGGEEFALALIEVGADEALTVAEGARAAIERHRFAFVERAFRLTVSAGVAVAAPGATDAEDLIRQADAKLYEAKRAGGNRVVS
jgi:diguanylate cyclase (GGDEF)-like protein